MRRAWGARGQQTPVRKGWAVAAATSHGSLRSPKQGGKVYQGIVMRKSVISAKSFTIISSNDHENSLVYSEYWYHHIRGFPGGSSGKELACQCRLDMRDARLIFLSQEDPLEKGRAIHSSILAWRIPRTEEPGGL